MKRSATIIRISAMAVMCVLLLCTVCLVPPLSKEKDEPDPTPTLQNYVAVSGDALSVVDTADNNYSYSELTSDLSILSERYGDKMSYSSIGTSLDGRSIYAVSLGSPDAEKQIIVSAGIHAREYLTPMLVMKQLELCLYNYDTAAYGDIPLSEIFEKYRFCILPMCNPDGITMAQFGLDSLNSEELKSTVRSIYQSDKSLGLTSDPIDKYLTYWKANARGVDLNRNFDTKDWEGLQKVTLPSYINYKGETPLSEPESKAMADYVSSLSSPVASLAIHSQGEIIYFDCGQDNKQASLDLARTTKELCGYKIIYEPRQDAAFEDFCALNKGIPSITVETGNYLVTAPIPKGEFDKIWNDCRDLWLHVAVSDMNKDYGD